MRLFGSPDAVLWRRVELYARMTTAGNASPAGDAGLFYAKRCADPECNCKKPTRRLDGELICSHCGGLWPSEIRVQLPNEYQHSPRPQTRDELLTELAEMDLILSKPTLWEQRALSVYVLGRLTYFYSEPWHLACYNKHRAALAKA